MRNSKFRLGHAPLGGQSGHEAGLRLLEAIYFQETGQPLPPILRTPRGKPCFAAGEYHFSISHSKNHAFCVLAKRNIAIDAEELGRRISPNSPGRILSREEYAQYAAAPDRSRAFLTFWVLKEAAVKLTGEGLRGIPNATAFRLDDPRVREIDGCLVAILTEEGETYAF